MRHAIVYATLMFAVPQVSILWAAMVVIGLSLVWSQRFRGRNFVMPIMKTPIADDDTEALFKPYRVKDGITLNMRKVLRFIDGLPEKTFVQPTRRGIVVQLANLDKTLLKWDGTTERIWPVERITP